MKFQRVALAAAAAVTGSALLASSAQAVTSVSMIWRTNGTATIGTPSVNVTSLVIADIVLIADDDASPVSGVFISIEFDPTELVALGASELSTVNLPGMANTMAPIAVGITLLDNTLGIIEGFDQGSLTTGAGVATVTLGSVRFHVVSLSGGPGEEDVVASLQNAGIDAIIGGSGDAGTAFIGADVVPEPGSSTLGAVALLTLLGIRRLRS